MMDQEGQGLRKGNPVDSPSQRSSLPRYAQLSVGGQRTLGFCVRDSRTGRVWGGTHHRGWGMECGCFPKVNTLLMEHLPVF